MVNKLNRKIRACLFPVFHLTLSIISVAFFLPVVVLLIFYRLVVSIIAKICRKDLHSFISGSQAYLVNEIPEIAFTNVLACFVVEGQISTERISQLFQERVLDLKDARGALIYEKLQLSWTRFMGYSFWKLDRNFLVGNHVRDYDYIGDLHLPKSCTAEDLQRVWPKLVEAPWKINQSPWEVLIVQDYCQEGKTDEPHSLIIFRLDHILGDGYSLISLTRVLFQSPFQMPKASRNNISWSLWDRLKVLFTLPYEMAKMFGIISKGRKIGGRTDGDNLHYSVSSNHSVDLMKSVKNAHNVSFSAVALSCVSGAIARALQNNGREPPKMLDIGYALPLVNHPGGMNVHMLATITELPCGAENSVDRLMKTHEVLRKINFRAILAAKALHDFLRLEAIIPSRLLRIMMMRGSNLGPSASVSNFPATLSKDFVDGLEFVDIFIALSSSTRVGLCISSGGVNGKQRFHFLLDKSIFGTESSAMKIASLYEEELEELLKHEYTDNQDFV